jgi:tRNA-2-methylthio-N6-dimethylallyladenosine synthase
MQRKLSELSFFIKTYGCQMNVYDSEKITDLLKEKGMTEVKKLEDADVIILNTCHIREKARHKVYTELGKIKKKKEQRKNQGLLCFVAVSGCVAQAEGERLLSSHCVDFVVGTHTYPEIPNILEDLLLQRRSEPHEYYSEYQKDQAKTITNIEQKFVSIEITGKNKFSILPSSSLSSSPSSFPHPSSAFIAIQEGCSHFCSYCVVPYTRGPETSRPAEDILKEVHYLVQNQGILELTLLGQNVNAYNGEAPTAGKWDFSDILYAISQIKGLQRIFYTSSHPMHFSDKLIQAHADLPSVMPFVHLPIQSGSPHILTAMNRRYTIEDYLSIIEKLRNNIPDIAMSSDFIVGFPGETEDDFHKTLALVETVRFAQAFSFKYSPRPGTFAQSMPNQIDENVKTQRLFILQNLLQTQQKQFNEACCGRTLPVLFQRCGKKPHQVLGKSPYMQSVVVHVDDPLCYIGTLKNVEIQTATLSSLSGVITEKQKACG